MSLRFAEEAMVVVLGLGLGSFPVHLVCSNLYNSGIDYYTGRKVFGSLRVYLIYGFFIGFILLIVLWDIAHAESLQLLLFKKPPFDVVEAE